MSKSEILKIVETGIVGINERQITKFCKKLYPVNSRQNLAFMLVQALEKYIIIKKNKNNFEEILKGIKQISLTISSKINQVLSELMPIIQTKYFPPKHLQIQKNTQPPKHQNINNLHVAINYKERIQCLCKKFTYMICPSTELVFECSKCSGIFHIQCMKITQNNYKRILCSFCFISALLPQYKIEKQIFIGYFKHYKNIFLIQFPLPSLNEDCKLQLRSMQVKGNQFKIKFPSIEIDLNGKWSIKMNKQDKNQVLTIPRRFLQSTNTITIRQQDEQVKKINSNYLIALYVVSKMQNLSIVRQTIMKSNFNKSKELLRKQFVPTSKHFETQIIKTKLTCCYFSSLLTLPVTTANCKHYQPFDLNSFLSVELSDHQSLCPICKAPAYEFQLNHIIFTIVQMFKSIPNIQYALFTKNQLFQVYDDENQICEQLCSNIQELHLNYQNFYQLSHQTQLRKYSKSPAICLE